MCVSDISLLRNSFVNLSLPLFSLAEPVPPQQTRYRIKGVERSFSCWDRIEIDQGDITLQQFIQYLKVINASTFFIIACFFYLLICLVILSQQSHNRILFGSHGFC